MRLAKLFLTVSVMAGWAATAPAANWPQWRGPNYNGSTDEKGLPSAWSKESAVWSVAMPGPSAATPIIWDGLVFIPTPDMATKTLHAMCLDRKTGKVLWDKTVSEGPIEQDDRSNFASPSPVTDAERVFFFFGNGTLVAFDHSGKQLWTRNIIKDYGELSMNWTFSSSPTLYGGRLFLQVLQRDQPTRGHGRTGSPSESFVLALDPATGTNLWRVIRPTPAVLESREAYSTPIPFEIEGKKEVLVGGGDCITAHDPETGAELWRSPDLNPLRKSNWRLIPSPVIGGGVILYCAPQGNNPIFAVKPGGSGVLPQSAIQWQTTAHRELSSDVPTPLFYDGDFFVLSESHKCLSRVDPANGNPRWTLTLPGFRKFEASPTGAEGRIYLMNFGGDVVVVDAAKGEIISTIPMGEMNDDETRASIAAAQGQLFIRTNQRLFCVAKK